MGSEMCIRDRCCVMWCVVFCVFLFLRAGGVLFKTRTQYQGVLGKNFHNDLRELPREPLEASRASRAAKSTKSRPVSERPWRPPGANLAPKSLPEAFRKEFWIPRSSVLDTPGDDFGGRERFI